MRLWTNTLPLAVHPATGKALKTELILVANANNFNTSIPALRSQQLREKRLEHQLIESYPKPHHSRNNSDRSLADYLHILKKHSKIILTTSLLSILCTTLYLLVTPKRYSAEAILRVDTYLPVLAGTSRELALQQQSTEKTYFSNQVAALKSLPLADRVLRSKELKPLLEKELTLQNKNSPSVYEASMSSLDLYGRMVRISSIKDTSMIRITATAKNPTLSAALANNHATEFIKYSRSDRLNDEEANINFLKQQNEDLEQQLRDSERAIATYAEKKNLITLADNRDISLDKVNSAQKSIEQARATRIEAQNKYEEALKALKDGSTFVDDRAITDMRRELAETNALYAEMGQRFTSNYPRMRELREKTLSLQKQISTQRQYSLRSLKAAYQAAKETERQLQQELENQNQEAFRVTKAQVELNRMKREYAALKDLQANVQMQLQQSKLSVGGAPQGNIILIEPAAVPDQPSSPKTTLAISIALLLGPLVGCSLAFIIDSLDQTLKTPEDVEANLDAQPLGIVPKIHREEIDSSLPTSTPSELLANLVTLAQPYCVASEAFRTIRAGIRLSSVDHQLKLILVTSSEPAEGKSTLVSNLGVVCAQDDNKTLVIDADLRQATLHKHFGLDEHSLGLSDVLTGQCDLDQCIQATQVEGLYVLAAGGAIPNPAEMVGSRKIENLLLSLREVFDYIIIDSPPVSPVADALILSSSVDGVLVVIRSGYTVARLTQSTLNKLKEVGANIIGTVLNDFEPTGKHGYSSYSPINQYNYGNPRWEQQQASGAA